MYRTKFFPSLMLFFFLLTIISLIVAYFIEGGLMFSPGKVSGKTKNGVVLGGIRSHAEIENDCVLCHTPMENDLATSCMRCHLSVSEEITLDQGLHSTVEQPMKCYVCHREHLGFEFDPSQEARFLYEHGLSRFALIHHTENFDKTSIDCENCHTGSEFDFDESQCKNCHEIQQTEFMRQHSIDFSNDCLECHDGLDTMANFDHLTTEFGLDGSHSETRCGACHSQGIFEGTVAECVGCHEEPDLHRNIYQTTCSECHSTKTWLPASLDGNPFDHSVSTGFSLEKHPRNENGISIVCIDCHGERIENFDVSYCIDCHALGDPEFMTEHQAVFSPSCLECHDGFDRMSNFDHNQVFLLDGGHAELTCAECHPSQKFVGTSTDCVSCHSEPIIHAGSFGTDCEYCHQTSSWTPALLRQHNFPLDHGTNNQLSCDTCHTSTYSEYTCYGCHEHLATDIEEEHREEGIRLDELANCVVCHPTGAEE